jgi:hypothetical protein
MNSQTTWEAVGSVAYARGRRLDDAPFKTGTTARVEWKKGWVSAWRAEHPGKEFSVYQDAPPSPTPAVNTLAQSEKSIKTRCPECGHIGNVRVEHKEQGAACRECGRVYRAMEREVCGVCRGTCLIQKIPFAMDCTACGGTGVKQKENKPCTNK